MHRIRKKKNSQQQFFTKNYNLFNIILYYIYLYYIILLKNKIKNEVTLHEKKKKNKWFYNIAREQIMKIFLTYFNVHF